MISKVNMSSNSPLVTHFIQPKFTLARLTKEDEIFSLIVTLVKKAASLVNDPKYPDLLLYVANLVENMVRKKDKINNNDMIINIYKEVFPSITEDEIQHLLNAIQHLRDNKLIQKIPIYKKTWYYFNKYILQRMLN